MKSLMSPIKVLIVDDHPVVRRGLQSLLADAKDVQVVGEASNGAEALQQIAATAPDVVLMDIRLPNADGVQVTRRVRRDYPQVKVIILTTYDDEQHLFNAIEAGAHGFLTKHADYGDIAAAIRAVHRGERLLSPSLVGKVLERFQQLARAQAMQASGLSDEDTTAQPTSRSARNCFGAKSRSSDARAKCTPNWTSRTARRPWPRRCAEA
ncbi:MAG: response regulator transcription factor [Chloroflexi bacterium]|nr:MAG: response regulator transcription factor [Chloroflexota bacterium]